MWNAGLPYSVMAAAAAAASTLPIQQGSSEAHRPLWVGKGECFLAVWGARAPTVGGLPVDPLLSLSLSLNLLLCCLCRHCCCRAWGSWEPTPGDCSTLVCMLLFVSETSSSCSVYSIPFVELYSLEARGGCGYALLSGPDSSLFSIL
jgi:hypothetical protein